MPDTYTDGVGVTRCKNCRSELRASGSQIPLTTLQVGVVQDLLLLAGASGDPWAEIAAYLEQTLEGDHRA